MISNDRRTALYQDFHQNQYEGQLPATRTSVSKVIDILLSYVRPASALDVGCGFGTWLAVAREKGIVDIRGIEGPWIGDTKLQVERELVDLVDLEQGFSLGRRFDLVACIEVAEHLSADAAPRLIESLVAHSDVVLFSAAIPYQGGHHHVNERFLGYWVELFGRHGFVPLDFIRPRIWNDSSVLWWLRQNLVVFAHERALASNPKLAAEQRPDRILSVVHPDMYASRAGQHAQIMSILGTGGTFEVKIQEEGMSITRR